MLDEDDEEDFHYFTGQESEMDDDEAHDGRSDDGSLIEFGSLQAQIEYDSLEHELRQRTRTRTRQADYDPRDRYSQVELERLARWDARLARPPGVADDDQPFRPPPPLLDRHVRPGSPPRPSADYDAIMIDTHKPASPLSAEPVWSSMRTSTGSSMTSDCESSAEGPAAGPSRLPVSSKPDVPLGPCLHPSATGEAPRQPVAACSFLRTGAVFTGSQSFIPNAPAFPPRRKGKRRLSSYADNSHIPSTSLDRLPAIRRSNASIDPPFSHSANSRPDEVRWSPSQPFHRAPLPPLPALTRNGRPSSRVTLNRRDPRMRDLLGSGIASAHTSPDDVDWLHIDVDVQDDDDDIAPPVARAPPSPPRQPKSTSWNVRVSLHDVDLDRGRFDGVMDALDIRVEGTEGRPPTVLPVTTTAFDGEVIDGVQAGLWTAKWGASREDDVKHWAALAAFEGLGEDGVKEGRPREGYVLARLKGASVTSWSPLESQKVDTRTERGFVNDGGQESGLSIGGLYYVCLHRATGTIEALYHDAAIHMPFQRLRLSPLTTDSGARPFSSFSVA
jgi:hypothetical protein